MKAAIRLQYGPSESLTAQEVARLSLKIAEEAKKNASRNKIRLAFFVYAFN